MLEQFNSLQKFATRPLVAYLTIFLLQFKIVWRIWDYKDLTFGDTSSYFTEAFRWYESVFVNIIWSPIYTAFFGSFLHITSDIYAVLILHRLVIIFAATMMVLALMRRLLPAGIAWLMAAWWAILPINFNTLYEVHLFSVIPILVACLLVFKSTKAWARGCAIAVLAASAVLVRNEFSLIFLGFVLVCLGYELWQMRTQRQFSWQLFAFNYGIPLLLAGSVVVLFYTRSHIQFPELTTASKPKHTLNICQIYAAGYQQRHTDWTGSPWTDCMSLMKRDFGQELPSLFQALAANPPAMIEHFLWNFSLTLYGLQVSLFNATSGAMNPDYAPVNLNQAWVIIPTIFVGLTWIGGLWLLWRDRKYWWKFWLQQRALGWSLLLIAASLAFFVIIPMQRPRPSYLFSLSIFLMSLTGLGLFVITHRWPKVQKLSVFLPAVMAFLLVVIQPYYPNQPNTNRGLFNLYRTLLPFQTKFAHSDKTFLSRDYPFELCSYLGGSTPCVGKTYTDGKFFASMPSDMPLEAFLKQQTVNLFYADNLLLADLQTDPRAKAFLTNPASVGWQLLALSNQENARWMLFERLN